MFANIFRGPRPALCLLLLSCLVSACSSHKNLMAEPVAQAAAPPGNAVNSYADVVARVAPSVVTIRADKRVRAAQGPSFMNDPALRQFFGRQMPQQQQSQVEHALGSGVVVNADGRILTNHHVIDGAEEIKIELADQRVLPAKVVGSDPPSDLALLQVDAKDLPALQLGDSDQVRVGDVVLALGNPLGIGQTVTSGIISAKGRATALGDGGFEDFLQTDAAINHGNSGGALVNTEGQLIGINSQILSPSGGSIGIGFAIPSNLAQNVMTQLLKDGKVHRGQLGIGVQTLTADLAAGFGLKDTHGVLVNSVKPDSPAAKAGLQQGDIITALEGQPVSDSNALRNRIAGALPGALVTLNLKRDGRDQIVKATLGEYAPPAGQKEADSEKGEASGGLLGISVAPLTPEIAKQIGAAKDTLGLAVTTVDPAGPAAQAGLREGDVLAQVNRQSVKTADDVKAALSAGGAGPVLLLINRHGQNLYVTVQLKP